MDDLLSEDWQQPAKPLAKPPPTSTSSGASAFASSYNSFRPSPQLQKSGTASPQTISRPSSTVNGGAKAPAGDSFGGLLNLKSQKPGSSLSMQERQKQILEEKRRQQEQNSQLWNSLGSGRGTPEIRQPSPAIPAAREEEDDILAAFNKDAPVDRASHLDPPSRSNVTSGRNIPAVARSASPLSFEQGDFNDDDDDPFGLNDMPAKRNGHAVAPVSNALGDDDDILGDLGKPVTELPPRRADSTPSRQQPDEDSSSDESDTVESRPPQDRQLAELVEMGFPADTARIALAENGGNVPSAVGWLLQQAHEESRQKARGEGQQRSRENTDHQDRRARQRDEREPVPSWMREEGRSSSAARQRNNASPTNGERDTSQVAQEFGSKFLKSANTFWKASQKQVAKTLSEFQQPEGESNQPKWMREPELDSNRSSSQRREAPRRPQAQTRDMAMTDEAAMLDAPRERPQKPSRPQQPQPTDLPQWTRSPAEVLPQRPQQQPQHLQRPTPQADKRPATRLSRQELEDQTPQAYVSPARRKKATPQPAPTPKPEPEVDLFSPEPPKPSSTPATSPAPPRTTSVSSKPRPQPAQPRADVPPRTIPSISPSALSTSASHRKAGGEHFKRGDYAAAHESYTAALTPLPATHPLVIIVLSNRSLTALKTGDAKMAVSDADQALEVIGPGFGANEIIDLGSGEGMKEMKEFYGKAVMRKAEALEHLEKYNEAAAAWRQAVAAGVGGAISLRGRDRCEKAAAPKPATIPARPSGVKSRTTPTSRPPPAKPLGNSLQRRTPTSTSSGEAVKKLRQANAAAEKADDEKFALTDQVDAKLAAWRGGKTENLRALLQSMDAVLWESAGWKKVGMSDLIMPNKVKIVYMKAIAKVHPDKIPQDATTEQRMISAAVFSTLNEAWDKFKKDNNL